MILIGAYRSCLGDYRLVFDLKSLKPALSLYPDNTMPPSDALRRSIRAQAISIGLAIAPFGLAFRGAFVQNLELECGRSFGILLNSFWKGPSQFAQQYPVLADDGTIIAATLRQACF